MTDAMAKDGGDDETDGAIIEGAATAKGPCPMHPQPFLVAAAAAAAAGRVLQIVALDDARGTGVYERRRQSPLLLLLLLTTAGAC